MSKQEQVAPTPDLKENNSNRLIASENNRSMWGLVINNAFKRSEDPEINKYRFMGISVEINGTDVSIAQGIWTENEANEIKNRVEDNEPDPCDYYYPEEESKNDNRWIIFTSNSESIEYLIKENIFIKGVDSKGKENYRLVQFPILGYVDKNPINIEMYPLKFHFRLDRTKVSMHVFRNDK